MPTEKKVTKLISRIYKSNAENMGLFFHIRAQQAILPTITIEQSIISYFKIMGISMDDWDIDSAKSTFSRMQKEYFKDSRNEST